MTGSGAGDWPGQRFLDALRPRAPRLEQERRGYKEGYLELRTAVMWILSLRRKDVSSVPERGVRAQLSELSSTGYFCPCSLSARETWPLAYRSAANQRAHHRFSNAARRRPAGKRLFRLRASRLLERVESFTRAWMSPGRQRSLPRPWTIEVCADVFLHLLSSPSLCMPSARAAAAAAQRAFWPIPRAGGLTPDDLWVSVPGDLPLLTAAQQKSLSLLLLPPHAVPRGRCCHSFRSIYAWRSFMSSMTVYSRC